ncbi:MAG: hypothetical protein Q8R25_02055 [bacterium]|nr:hypothetical protein [bacterium]
MNDQPTNAVKKRVQELAIEFKEKFEQSLRKSEQKDLVEEIKGLRAKIEALGYTVAILAYVDEKEGVKKLQLAVWRDGSTDTRH